MKRALKISWPLLTLALLACGGVGTSKKDLRTAVDAKQTSLDNCYGDALAQNEAASGEMTVKLHVAEKSGTIEKVEVVDPGFADTELASCVEQVLVGTELAKKPSVGLNVEYQLVFTPSS